MRAVPPARRALAAPDRERRPLAHAVGGEDGRAPVGGGKKAAAACAW